MENLFYNVDIKNKFDLKGSERNRRVNPSNQNGSEEIVLMDENLLQSKCFVFHLEKNVDSFTKIYYIFKLVEI